MLQGEAQLSQRLLSCLLSLKYLLTDFLYLIEITTKVGFPKGVTLTERTE